MKIKVMITIDDDRHTPHPHRIRFEDSKCNLRFSTDDIEERMRFYRALENIKVSGSYIDPDGHEHFF